MAPFQELSTQKSTVIHEEKRKLMIWRNSFFPRNARKHSWLFSDQLKKIQDFQLVGKKIVRKDIRRKSRTANSLSYPALPEMVYESRKKEISTVPNQACLMSLSLWLRQSFKNNSTWIWNLGLGRVHLRVPLVCKRITFIEWSDLSASGHNSQETFSTYEK